MEPITTTALVAAASTAACGLGLASLAFRRETVSDLEIAVLVRDRSVVRELAPGRYWIRRGRSMVVRWDTRPEFCATGLQEILTADRVPVKVSAEAKLAPAAPRKLWATTSCTHHYVERLLRLALRETVSSIDLEELLRDRATANTAIETYVRERAWTAGIEICSARVMDITVRSNLKEAFAAKARAKAEAMAQLERARGEAAVLRKLANAARVLEDNEALLRLKRLQTAELAAKGQGNTLVLGLDDERATKAH